MTIDARHTGFLISNLGSEITAVQFMNDEISIDEAIDEAFTNILAGFMQLEKKYKRLT